MKGSMDNHLKLFFTEARSAHVEDEISTIAASASGAIVGQEPQPQNILLQHFQKFCLQKELESSLLAFKHKVERGVTVLFEAAQKIAKSNHHIREVSFALSRFTVYLMKLPERLDAYSKQLEQNISIQAECKIPDHTVALLYDAAKWLYKAERFEDASAAFGVLTLLDAKKDSYWIGFGNAEHSLKRYENAFFAYSIASYMNPFRPALYLFACRSRAALAEFDNIVRAVDLTVALTHDDKKHKPLRKIVAVAKSHFVKKPR
jgi:tetratricopeptide (TPR) repeat protein